MLRGDVAAAVREMKRASTATSGESAGLCVNELLRLRECMRAVVEEQCGFPDYRVMYVTSRRMQTLWGR